MSHIASLTEATKTTFGPYDIGAHEDTLAENKEKVLQVNYLGFLFFLVKRKYDVGTSESDSYYKLPYYKPSYNRITKNQTWF